MSCLDQHHHCHRQKEQPHSSLHQKPQSRRRSAMVESLETVRSTSLRRKSRYYRIDISQTAKQNRSTSISIDANRGRTRKRKRRQIQLIPVGAGPLPHLPREKHSLWSGEAQTLFCRILCMANRFTRPNFSRNAGATRRA